MNKGIYRLIFNKARGLLMVVGELATNMTKSSLTGTIGTARLSSLRASFSSLRFACLLALGHVLFIGDVHARILVDRSAPSSQQATVLSAANGVPQVNIQTPTAGGVSRNQYTQFDVNSRGVILNNSRTTTSSQLGGIVSANPHLITGTARIIVNEVNSTNPSLLNGHIEVAGTRADVVFANPAGISCSGCGFINATKATLTTGKPTYSNGHLNGYRVQSGTVQINGDGLDTSTADYTQIIARSVKVNANIWANDLSVTAGANQVSSDATTVTEISPVGAQPNFAIDVSSLGGMYAGKIRLVGTENGVGVRHAGDIGAGVGGLTLSADGRLEHSGSTSSEAALAIQVTDDIRNTGTLYAGDKLAISTNKNIQQDGIAAALHSVSINAQGHLSGQADAVLAAGINSNGVLTSSNQLADIDVNVKGRVDLQGQQIALNDIRITGQAITLDNSVQQADHLGLDARTGDVTMTDSRSTVLTVDAQGHSIHITDSDLSLNQATLIANKNSIDLTQSTLLVQQELTLNAVEELVTDSATVLAESLNVQANRLLNRKGLIQQSGSPSLELQFAGNVDNTDGTILSNSELTIATDHLHNESGEISSAKALVLNVRSHVDNTQGIITSTDTATINSGEFNNDQGRIQSVKTLSIDTNGQALINTNSDNTAGVISGDALDITASTLNNNAGYIGAQQTLGITTTADSSNVAGVIESADSLTLNTAAFNNDQGRLQSAQALSIDTNSNIFINTNSGNTAGVISGDGLDITASTLNNNAGYIGAQQTLDITTTADSSNVAGVIESADSLTLNTAAFNNDQGRLQSAQALSIDTNSNIFINTNSGNTAGVISGDGLDITASTLNNNAGYIGAQQTLSVTTTVDSSNVAGVIESADSLTLNTAAFNNDQGSIQSATALTIDTNGNALTNTNSGATGGLISGDALTINASILNNISGYVGAQKALNVITTGDSSNVEGIIESADSTTLTTAALNNDQGRIQSATALTINTNDNILTNTNSGATGGLISGDALTIDASILNNTLGYVGAQKALNVTTTGDSSNVEGIIESADSIALTTAALDNDQGRIQSATALTIDTNGNTLTNTNSGAIGGLISGDALAINTGNFDNVSGYVGAREDATLIINGSYNNYLGRLETQGNLLFTSRNVNNQQGLIRSAKNLTLKTQPETRIDNTNTQSIGGIRSGGTLTLDTDSLLNTDGFIGAENNLSLSTADDIQNNNGEIVSVGILQIASDALNNDQGLLESGGDLSVNTRGHTLRNTRSGVDRGIISAENITLNTGVLNNAAGFIGASKNITLNSDSVVTNTESGVLLGLGDITITGTEIDNTTGQVQSGKTIDLNVGTGTITNNGSLLRANQGLHITASTLLNRNTQLTNKGIEAATLRVNVNTVDNTGGQFIADELTIRGSGRFTNQSGKVSASRSVNIVDVDGSASRTQSIDNTNGTFIAGEQLSFKSSQLLGQGQVLSQGSVSVDLSGDYTHVNDFIANTDLNFTLTGQLLNQSLLRANRNLTITANSINNTAIGELSGINTTLVASGDVTNTGLIDGTNTSIDANRLFNLGTGRIYGDHVSIEANVLQNHASGGKAAVIAARNELDLGVGTLSNRDHSLIYSDGSASIGGAITNRQATGRAGTITNASATIESAGTLAVNANRLDNQNLDFRTAKQSSSVAKTEYAESLSFVGSQTFYAPTTIPFGTRYDASQVSFFTSEVSFAVLPSGTTDSYTRLNFIRKTTTDVITHTDPGKIRSGQNLTLTVGTVNNTNSEITAGGSLQHSGSSLNNTQATGTQTVQETGTFTQYYRNRRRGRDSQVVSQAYTYSGPGNLAVKYNVRYRAPGQIGPAVTYTTTGVKGTARTSTVNLTSSVYRGNTSGNQRVAIGQANQQQVDQSVLGAAVKSVSNRTVKSLSNEIISVTGKTQRASNANRSVTGVNVNQANIRQLSSSQEESAGLLTREQALFTEITNNTRVIRSSNTPAIVSNNSLFVQNSSPASSYLVETDPRFTNTRQYLSSAFVTQQIAQSPSVTNKRLGDGFYEQRVVRDQIVALTGRRYLNNFTNDDTQYKHLLDKGIEFAQSFNLRPGIRLSDAQVALLANDIVWLEEQDVLLDNGSIEKVLVPKVYAIVSEGDLLPSGSLLSGESIESNSDTFVNSGDILARTSVDVNAKDFEDVGGRLQASSAQINASNDVTLQGINWRLDDSLDINAGRDIRIATQQEGQVFDNSRYTEATRRATITIGRDNTDNTGSRLNITAGRNATLTGAEIINRGTGDTVLSAGNNLQFDTVIETASRGDTVASLSSRNEIVTTVTGQGNVSLRAGGDLSLRGSDISAEQSLALQGDSITLTTAENRIESDFDTANKKHIYKELRHDGVNLSAGSDLTLDAIKTLSATGANATAGNSIALNAGGDIDISVAQDETYSYEYEQRKKSFGRKTTSIKESFTTTNVGGNLIAGNNLTINSTINPDGTVTSNGVSGSVLIRGADVEASNNVAISGESVTIADQKEVDFKREETYKRGFGGLSSHHQGQTTRTELVDSADITANTQNLDLVSAKDITITGSNVIAGQETRLNAGQDITIESAESTTTQTSFDHKSKFGLSLSGLTVSLGETKENVDTSTTSTSQVGSTVGSLNGNISIDAQRNATIAASDIIARGGDISVAADKVDIVQRDHVVETETKHEVSFSGVSAGLSGGAADSVNTMVSSGERIQHTDNDALKALHTWKVANAAQALPDQIDDLQNIGDDFNNLGQDVNKGATSGINLSISAGSNSSESHSTSTQRTARGGSLSAGGALSITARGDQAGNKDSGDILAQGAYLNGDTVTLNAKDDLILTSAENTSESNSTQSSRSAAVGLSIGSSGFNVYVEGSRSDGITEQSGDQYLETRIQGAQQVTLISGDDTTLEGAEVRAEQITATVGGDLSITSQQDNNQFNQHSESRGGRLTYGTNTGASLNASETTATANFESVQEQSGFFAGEGGFDITVENNTALTGGVIASTATADNNTLSTNSLTTRNLENVSEYEIESKSVGVSVGGDSQGVSGGASGDDDHQESTTYNVISDGSIDIRNGDRSALAIVKNNEADATNALENTFSEDKVQDVQDTAEAVQIFGEEAYRIVGKKYEDLENAEAELAAAENTEGTSQERIDELKQEVQRQEDALPVSKEVAHAFVGGVSAIIGGGNVLQGAAAAGINEVAAQTIDDSLPSNAIARNALAVGVGSVVGGTEGALIAGSADRFNRQLHPTERKVIDELAKDWADSDGSISYEEARKRLALTAFGNVDGIGGLYTNDDVEANSILKNNGFSFVDGDGVERQAFTRDEDYWRPWTYLDQQNTPEGQAFYAENITPYLTTPSQDRTNRVLNEEYQKVLDNLPKTENIKPDEFVLTYLSSSIVGGRVLIKDGRDYKETTDEQWESVYGSDNVADVKHVVQSAVLIGAAANTVTRRGVGVKDRSSDVPEGNGATNIANTPKLNNQILAEEVASGHGFQKHVIQGKEFENVGVSTKQDYQKFVENLVNSPTTEVRYAANGKRFYLDNSTKTVVVKSPNGEATAFRPDYGPNGIGWDNFLDQQVPSAAQSIKNNPGFDPAITGK